MQRTPSTAHSALILIVLLSLTSLLSPVCCPSSTTTASALGGEIPTVSLYIEPHSIVYEGDIINCTITGHPTEMYRPRPTRDHRA